MSIQEIKRRLHSLSGVVKDEDQILILMHDNPDPDSLASAFGLQYLLRNLAEKPSLIGYSGIVGRAENRAMIKHLEIKLCPMSRIPIKEYSCIAMVDTQPSTGNNSLPAELFPRLSSIIIRSGPPVGELPIGKSKRSTTSPPRSLPSI